MWASRLAHEFTESAIDVPFGHVYEKDVIVVDASGQ